MSEGGAKRPRWSYAAIVRLASVVPRNGVIEFLPADREHIRGTSAVSATCSSAGDILKSGALTATASRNHRPLDTEQFLGLEPPPLALGRSLAGPLGRPLVRPPPANPQYPFERIHPLAPPLASVPALGGGRQRRPVGPTGRSSGAAACWTALSRRSGRGTARAFVTNHRMAPINTRIPMGTSSPSVAMTRSIPVSRTVPFECGSECATLANKLINETAGTATAATAANRPTANANRFMRFKRRAAVRSPALDMSRRTAEKSATARRANMPNGI